MSREDRLERLREDHRRLTTLKKGSAIFDFTCNGDPPDRYTLIFRGNGAYRDRNAPAGVNYVNEHNCEIRLSYAYPDRPPDLRWVTPLYHPNVTFSGFITLRDLGLVWNREVGLDVVCERLWDVARLAFVDLDRAANFNAKKWYEEECEIPLPVDPRPLRDAKAAITSNVIRYERRGGERRVTFPTPPRENSVLVIDENTPAPPMPRAVVPNSPANRDNDDDVFYIGDD